MNEAKILALDPSCWSWVNIWRLSWAGGHLKASQDVRSTTKVGTAHQVATGKTATACGDPTAHLMSLSQRKGAWCEASHAIPFDVLEHFELIVCVSVSSFRAEMEEFGSDKWDQYKVGICPLRDRLLLQFSGGLAGSRSCWHSALFSDNTAFSSAFWRLLEKSKSPQAHSPTWKWDFARLGSSFFLLCLCWTFRRSWHGAHTALCFPNLNIYQHLLEKLCPQRVRLNRSGVHSKNPNIDVSKHLKVILKGSRAENP